MDTDTRIQYHLRELDSARNAASGDHISPPFADSDRCVLDVGCGIGQTFVARGLAPSVLMVGVDRDEACLRYGQDHFAGISFLNAAAERLPFADACFDRVISRVTLPYTDIPLALREISRVLRPGGVVWLTLHPFSRSLRQLGDSARKVQIKALALRIYVLANGVLFHLAGRVVRVPGFGVRESVQTESAMKRELHRVGLEHVTAHHGEQFVMTAVKKADRPSGAAADRDQ